MQQSQQQQPQQQQQGLGVGVGVAPPTVVITNPPYKANPSIVQGLNSSVCKSLAITQLTIGIAVFVLDLFMFLFSGTFFQGWWGGAFVIAAGGLGLPAAKSKSRDLVNATGAMSIVSAILSVTCMALSFVLAASTNTAGVVMGVFMGIAFLAEIGVSIAHSVVCFGPACNSGMLPPPPQRAGQATVIYQTGKPAMVMSQGGYTVPAAGMQATQLAYPTQQVTYPGQQQAFYPVQQQGTPAYPNQQQAGSAYPNQQQVGSAYQTQPPAYQASYPMAMQPTTQDATYDKIQ